MQTSKLRTTPNRVVFDIKGLRIQAFDTYNDYPQRVLEIAHGSHTISKCLSTYDRFVYGQGVGELGKLRIGTNTLSSMIRKACQDHCTFHGFALHVRYNALGEICGIDNIPFEFVRLGIANKDTGEVTEIAINRDWQGKYRSPTKSNTIYCTPFNPDNALAEIEAAGGVANYNGQVLYCVEDGLEYPHCIYEEVLTDGATQVACANIRYRNAKNGFMPYGMLVTRKTKDYNPDNDSDERGDMAEELGALQGDVNVGKLFHVTLEPGDEVPNFIKMDGENYDGAFKSTEESTKENIGEAFMQPPILRCEQVSNGFADDMMEQATKFYNSITSNDRQFVEENFKAILRLYDNTIDVEGLQIKPLSYGQTL